MLYTLHTGGEENNTIIGDEKEMALKEIRNIFSIGPRSSCGVIHPRNWLRFCNLKSKDCVESISDGTVIMKVVGED